MEHDELSDDELNALDWEANTALDTVRFYIKESDDNVGRKLALNALDYLVHSISEGSLPDECTESIENVFLKMLMNGSINRLGGIHSWHRSHYVDGDESCDEFVVHVRTPVQK